MKLKTYRVRRKNESAYELVVTSALDAFVDSAKEGEHSFASVADYHRVVFIAVREINAAAVAFVKELVFETSRSVDITSKIKATCRIDHVTISSPTNIGITLEVGGVEKMLLNGDLIERRYKVFDLQADAEQWIKDRLDATARHAV